MKPEPFLRWVGSKRALAQRLVGLMPRGWRGRYVEPFLGSGAVFLELAASGRLDGRRPLLADASERLVRTWRAVAAAPDQVYEAFRRRAPADRVVTEAEYLAARGEPVDEFDFDVEVAAWMLFVNRTGFNGLYRVNRMGEFNVPFGHKMAPLSLGLDNLLAVSEAVRRTKAELCVGSFDRVLTTASPASGDFVYADPPYDADGPGFTAYTAGGFTDDDQARLAALLGAAVARGARALASNGLTQRVRVWYAPPAFRVEPLSAPRRVAADAGARVDAIESVIFCGYRPRRLRAPVARPVQADLLFEGGRDADR